MPKTLPIELIAEKNKLNADHPWLAFLAIHMPASDDLYYVNNTEDITWPSDGGQLYGKLGFKLGAQRHVNTGVISSLELKLSNVNRVLQPYVDALDGGIGAEVTLSIVSMDNISSSTDYAELTTEFEILSANCDFQWVTFVLGGPNLLRQRFPSYIYLAQACNWVRHFKGPECAYPGLDTTCSGTFDDCETKGNSNRFGGHKGLSPNGFRIA